MQFELINGTNMARVKYIDPKTHASSIKVVNMKELFGVFQQNSRKEQTPLYGPGFLKSAIIGSNEYVWFFYPGHVREICFTNGQNMTVYVPRMIIRYQFYIRENQNRDLKNSTCYTISDGDFLNKDVKLYDFSMNNYSRSYGPGICWGTFEDSVRKQFYGTDTLDTFRIANLQNTYFAAPFNSDLGGNGISGEVLYDTLFRIGNVYPEKIAPHSVNFDYEMRNYYRYLSLIAEIPDLNFTATDVYGQNSHIHTLDSEIRSIVS